MAQSNPFPPAFGKTSALPQAEADRLAELSSYEVLDTPPERQFDRIVALARVLFDTPISAITLVDQDRQWFKARSGLDAPETPREDSFCSHAMEHGDVFVVPDATQDGRFAENPLVLDGPKIRFYAGAPLRSPGGHNLGALCVISSDPRGDFSSDDRRRLQILASVVGNELELKRRAQQAHKMLFDRDLALREAQFKIKNSFEYATLLAEVQAADISTEKLSAIAVAAWQQYAEAGGVLMSSVKSLRERLSAADYVALTQAMPGFAM
jgi:GAF domain-containing protein